jgi:hypothetical protein
VREKAYAATEDELLAVLGQLVERYAQNEISPQTRQEGKNSTQASPTVDWDALGLEPAPVPFLVRPSAEKNGSDAHT